jgi:hypothetical protein
MDFQLSKSAGNFLTRCRNINFLKGTLVHGVR